MLEECQNFKRKQFLVERRKQLKLHEYAKDETTLKIEAGRFSEDNLHQNILEMKKKTKFT